MAVPPWSLVSLAEVKAEAVADLAALERNALFERCAERASVLINEACNRLLIYQGVLEDDSSIVAPFDLGGATSPATLAGQPSAVWPFRTLALQVDDPKYQLTAGTFTITGTGLDGSTITETVSVDRGGVWWRGTKAFASVTSVAWAGLVGAVAGLGQMLRVGTVKPYVDYATVEFGSTWFRLIDYPVIKVLDFSEDVNRIYTGTSKTEGIDFLVEMATGRVVRVSGSYPYPLLNGVRTTRVAYVAGFRDSLAKENVPALLRSKAAQVAITIYREIDRQMQGVSSRTDAAGATTRYQPSGKTKELLDDVLTYGRMGYPANVEREAY